MPDQDCLVLVGVKSPLVVEYEETLCRAGISLLAGVSLGDIVRMLDRSKTMDLDTAKRAHQGQPFLPCAFASTNRIHLHQCGIGAGLTLARTLVDPTAVVASSTRVRVGGFINAGAVIGASTFIGECAVINRVASVGHHSILGDFVSIGPGATLASNIRVGDGATIGAGAVILPGVSIGAGSVVSAGSVVRRDVPDDTVVAGNPARETRLAAARTKTRHNTQE